MRCLTQSPQAGRGPGLCRQQEQLVQRLEGKKGPGQVKAFRMDLGECRLEPACSLALALTLLTLDPWPSFLGCSLSLSSLQLEKPEATAAILAHLCCLTGRPQPGCPRPLETAPGRRQEPRVPPFMPHLL